MKTRKDKTLSGREIVTHWVDEHTPTPFADFTVFMDWLDESATEEQCDSIVKAVNSHEELVAMVKQLKRHVNDSRFLMKINELLARLEAAEKVVETCIEDYTPGNYVHELYEAWRKEAGK